MVEIFQDGLLVFQKLRTDGKQTVVVQHVRVSEADRPSRAIGGAMQ